MGGLVKMENKSFLLLILSVLFSLFLLPISYAHSCGIVTPANNGFIGTDGLINITFTSNATLALAVVHLNLSSASTSNSTSFEVSVASNETSASLHPRNAINFSLNDTNELVLEPSNDYVLTAWVENATPSHMAGSFVCNSTVTGITIDRGDTPTVPSTAHAADTEFDDVTTTLITYTVNGFNTTGCRIAFLEDGASPRFTGTNTFAMVHSADSCTYTVGKSTIPDNSYNVYVRASDGTNESISTKLNFKIKTMGGEVGGGGITGFGDGDIDVAVAQKVASNEMTNLIILILIIVVLWYYFNHSGKK